MSKVARTFMLNEGDTDKLLKLKAYLKLRSMSAVIRELVGMSYSAIDWVEPKEPSETRVNED